MGHSCCCAYVFLRLAKNIFTFMWWFVKLCLHLNMDLKIGQIGTVESRFSKSMSKMKIVSFTETNKYMRCVRVDVSDKAPKRIKEQLYLFSTKTMIQKGSHMGNTKIHFDGLA